MCGISGVVQRRTLADPESRIRQNLEKMIQVQRHRGPDGDGIYLNSNFGFGHNRLAILDLSEAGRQPMVLNSVDTGQLVVTYNGEIYNYIELREELKSLGQIFRTQTDTEVLLHAYDQWGEACLDKFNGMFAFVLFDQKRNRLFGARDRFGVKPLHYRISEEQFSFASEIKALLEIAPSAGPDLQTIADYLYAGHLNISERTFFSDIKELRGGHKFTFDLASNQFQISRWYDLAKHVQTSDIDLAQSAGKLKELLYDSVRLRLRSDVRVGTCLSGGIDSSSIASIASKISPTPGFIGITASSIDPANDETHYAKLVADAMKLEWHNVRPTDFREDFDALVESQDEPVGGLSVFMQFHVMKTARSLKVPVLLDGQGGDEVFLGYPKYLQAKAWPGGKLFLKKTAAQLGFIEQRDFQRDLIASMPAELASAKAHLIHYRRTLSDSFAAQIFDLTVTNLPQLLRYEDRNSMHHSIETRLPFLDYRLVEFGVSLPFKHKISSAGTLKYVLREAMREIVPDMILNRSDKVGFAAPTAPWGRHFAQIWDAEVKTSKFVRDICSKAAASGPSAMSLESQWKLINLAIWSKKYFT